VISGFAFDLNPVFLGVVLALALGIAGGLTLWLARRRRN